MRVDDTPYFVVSTSSTLWLKNCPSSSLKRSLGSASVITDESGNIINKQRWHPHGGARWLGLLELAFCFPE